MNKSLLDDRQKFIIQQSAFLSLPKKRPHATDQHTPSKTPATGNGLQNPKQEVKNGTTAEGSSNATGQTSQQKFAALCRIVNFLQSKHLEADYAPRDLDQILRECNLEITSRVKAWLKQDALQENPRIKVTNSGGQYLFSYKPPINATNWKNLLRLLKEHHRTGAGGILVEDIKNSVPNADRVLKHIGNEIVIIQGRDKKEVVFYNDKSAGQPFNEELKSLWKAVPMDNVDSITIDQYLTKRGIFHVRDRCVAPPTQRKHGRRRNFSQQAAQPKLLNTHMKDVLQEYNAK